MSKCGYTGSENLSCGRNEELIRVTYIGSLCSNSHSRTRSESQSTHRNQLNGLIQCCPHVQAVTSPSRHSRKSGPGIIWSHDSSDLSEGAMDGSHYSRSMRKLARKTNAEDIHLFRSHLHQPNFMSINPAFRRL
jgi:hypothetical protein